MKIDHNHIDDLFKEGLEDYTATPKQEVWKRISGKLLWKEILRLNFTNIPMLWTGAVAAGVIIITFALLWPGAENNTPATSTLSQNQSSIQSSSDQNVPPAGTSADFTPPATNPENTPRETRELTEIKEPAEAAASVGNREANTATKEQSASARAEAGPAKEKPIPKNISEAGQPVVMNDQKSRPVNAEPLPERPANPAVNEPVDATHRAERRQSASVEPATTGTASTGNEQPGTASQRPAAIPSVEKVQPSLITKNQDTKNEQAPEPEVINADYDPGMFAGEAENTDDQNSNLKKMHSLSFSIGQLLRGKYKPPQRSFGQSTMEMYRGTASYFSTSLYFVPEATEYARPMSKSRENSYGAGWALSYHTSHYLIQGGIEMVRSNDLGDYMVNMTSWDSVGYYQHVTGFVIDPDNPDSVILQTETVTIMDSVDHQSHQQTHNRYTYLQFPLMIGYKAMESGIFSAYIKAGPSFSFLLNTKEPPLNYSRPDATINGIDNFTAPRLSMNIQILVSLSLNFQITERFGILIEPTYRYYLNPVYDLNGESLKNPYGIGARGGLFINF